MTLRTTLILSALTLALTACGGNEESTNSSSTAQTATPTTKNVETITETVTNKPTNEASIAKTETAENQQVADNSNEAAKTAAEKPEELPHGRLNGIVDTGNYKQAIINNAGQVIRLKEGQSWQGWQIKQISHNMIMIHSGDVEHQLALHEDFHAPKLSQTEIDRRNQLMQTQQTLAPTDHTTVERTIPPLQLTEEQREIVQSRLIASQ
ncbi:MAG: hypothetical protein ACWA5U_00155 [bacterium]